CASVTCTAGSPSHIAGVRVAVGVLLAVASGVCVGVATGGQPASAALTASSSSLMATAPSPLRSKLGQSPTARLPSAMFTPISSSLTPTPPLPSQSPVHATSGDDHAASNKNSAAPGHGG